MPVRMRARRRDEQHRAATPLELFFDLCFVVAVAQAGRQLAHALAEGHPGHGISGYLMLFFAVWWAWMNFSWFASAYDTDDSLYRVVTLVQMAGVLVLAAGVPRAFEHSDFTVIWFGYLVMRLALVTQWLRVAHDSRGAERRTALCYALGVTVCQIGWLGLLALPEHDIPWVFVVVGLLELAVPALAERERQTTWHPHHISERYGLFTIIVLGETIAAATLAVQAALDRDDALGTLLPIAAAWTAAGLRRVLDLLFGADPPAPALEPSVLPVGLWALSGVRLGGRVRCGHRGRGGGVLRQGASVGVRGGRLCHGAAWRCSCSRCG